ncbi:hypothetical protein [Spiroplasma clarkii]|uniref:hypothetical protein n=1 Tax=Spiroplasma clarkii TaxID=2139 RepID=UPI0011BAB270|nr:hypothetical protein [Spiroplasma clarkii]
MYALVKNLKEVIELRMPVELTIESIEETEKLDEKQIKRKIKETKRYEIFNGLTEFKRKVKTKVPKFVKVKDPKEYLKTLDDANIQGFKHYPFVSYKINKN